MDTFSTTIFDSLSDELKGRVALSDGVLHVSAELKGKMELDALVARLRHRGRIAIEWHTPKKFDALFAGLLSGGIVLEDKNGVSRSDNVKRYVIELFRKAHELKASDIHITYNGQYTLIDLRRLGTLQYYSQLGGEEGKQLIQGIFQSDMSQAEASFSPFERQDGRIVDPMVLPNGVFSVRLHTEPIQSSMAANGKGVFLAIRMLYDATSAHGTLTERAASLGFTKEQGEMLLELTERSGLVVISGPTGHGKTTLLKHVFETMAEYQPGKNYVSFEDPPEYSLNGVKQVPITTKTINNDEERARAYNDALAGGMRMDPDTLMIGEIRYIEAAKAAISAALTGHGVLATLHANNGFGVIRRMPAAIRYKLFV